MGQKELKLLSQSQLSTPKSHINISRNIFDFQYIIGRGGFGKVWKVILKSTKTTFALKEMSKVKIIDRHSIESITNELKILSNLKNPFIINMHFAFQDYSNLYLVMDYLKGGDLRYHISKNDIFTEKQTKFFISNIILGLEYIHKNNIIHRDIKPENLVLDNKGYVHITDFGVAKINEKDNSNETSGTPGYMAPEVLFMQNHTFTCDFFALGVIGYEFCIGHRPYLGRSRQEIKNVILHKQVKIKFSDIDKNNKLFINWNWSKDGIDFINKLIMRKPKERIGYYGINELKEHKWMKNVNWDDILNKKIKAPFIPKNNDNFDKSYCEGNDKIGDETMERYRDYINDEMFTKIFKDYFYCRFDFEKFNYLKLDKKNFGSFSMKNLKYGNKNEKENKNNIKKKQIFSKDNFDEKTLRNTHSIVDLNINKDKENNNFKTTRNKIFDNCQLNEKVKSFSPISLNKSNSVQIISFNSKFKSKKKELKKPKKQYKSISSSNLHNLKIIYENNKNKMRVNKSLTIDNKKNYILNNSVKRNSSNFESESLSKKIQNSPFSIKNKNNILKRPISKTDIHELFDSESFQLLNNLNNKVEKYTMTNRLNNKKNNQKLNSEIEIDKANSQRIGNEKEFVFQSKIMSWINQTNIIAKSNSKDKVLNNLVSDKNEIDKNIDKQDLINNIPSSKVNLKNKNKSFNINYSNSRISKNSTKNSEGGNNKLSKNSFSLNNKYKCFSPISKKC